MVLMQRDGPSLLFTALDGSISAVDALTGERRWSVATGPPLVSSSSSWSATKTGEAQQDEIRRAESEQDQAEQEEPEGPGSPVQDTPADVASGAGGQSSIFPGAAHPQEPVGEVVIPGADGRLYSIAPAGEVQVTRTGGKHDAGDRWRLRRRRSGC